MVGVKDVLGTVKKNDETALYIQKLREDAIIPTRGTENSAGLDLYAIEDYQIRPHTNQYVRTGIAVAIPNGYVGLLFPRSGWATKKHLRLSNSVGVIDSDYRGEVIVSLYDDSHPDAVHKINIVNKGDRIAQLVVVPYIAPQIIQVDQLSSTERGEGGFGSTGK